MLDADTQSLATSALHPYVASSSADGAVLVTNAMNVSKRKAMEPGARLMHKVFRMVRHGDAFTLRHGYFPEGVLPNAQGQKTPVFAVDRWDPSVSVTSVAWCPNARHALLLASGTSAGLVHIAWIESSS